MDWLALSRGVLLALESHLVRYTPLRLGAIAATLAVLVLGILFIPPFGARSNVLVDLPKDASVEEMGSILANERIIASPLAFKVLARISGADRDFKAGQYLFESPTGIAIVVYRIARGDLGVPTKRVTFPEGTTVREMGSILKEELPEFDVAAFVEEALPYEGYLFPDTYDIPVSATPDEIITRMRETFTKETDSLVYDGHSLAEIVIMASLLEKEARTTEDRKMISGILWERIAIGMALQVDAVFGYINERDTYHPSFEDLEVDSPYNTYTNRGLPPGPIGNPGRDALVAATAPTKSEYLYYLTGKDGVMYYATTFEEHKKNRARYLDI